MRRWGGMGGSGNAAASRNPTRVTQTCFPLRLETHPPNSAGWQAERSPAIGAPSAHPFISPAVRRPDHPSGQLPGHGYVQLQSPLAYPPPRSARRLHPEPPCAARPSRVPLPREVVGTHRLHSRLRSQLRSRLRRAEHETESRRGEQPGDGRGEPAASAGKSRGFSVPRPGRERGMGGGGTRPPAGPASRASWSSATCTEDTQRRHQGTRGALAPFLDAILRRRDEGWHTRVAPVDPGLSSALPASLETKTVWDRTGRRCSLCRRRLRTQGVQPPFPQCSPGWREGRKEK